MKKSLIYVYGVIIFLLLLPGSTFRGQGEAQVPKWTVGDSWEYDKTMEILFGYTDEVTYEVKDILDINVENTNIKVYDLECLTVLLDSESHHYISTDDLATVKIEDYFNVRDEIGTVVHTFHPPRKELNFPLYVGKTWASSYREEEYNDYWDIHFNTTTTIDYAVEVVETIDVEAGTFECYRIKSERRSGVVTYIWYSSEVKNIVKTALNLTGPADMELTSYHVSESEGDVGGFNLFSMPNILLLFLIPIIIIVLILGIMFRRKKQAQGTITSMMNVQPYYVTPEYSFPSDQQPSGYPPPQYQQPNTQSQAPSPYTSMQPQGQPIRCPNCYNVFDDPSLGRPISVRCPYCGMGIYMD